MKKLLFVLIPVLLLGGAFASFGNSVLRNEAVGLQAPEPAPGSEVLPDLLGGGIQAIDPCVLECKSQYADCKELQCPGPECSDCFTFYQACLANC